MKKVVGALAVAAVVGVLVLGAGVREAMSAEEPSYRVLEDDGALQVRAYGPLVVARVSVKSQDRDEAANIAFRPLASYIFEGDRPEGKIKMTAPVTQEQEADGSWVVEFVMPSRWTLQTLPRPKDARVSLHERQAFEAAVIRFSGRATDEDVRRREAELRAYMKRKGLQAAGDAIVAYYNAPYVPGLLRRNEILIPLQTP